MKLVMKIYYEDDCDSPVEIINSPVFLKDFSDTKRLAVLYKCIRVFSDKHKQKAKIYCEKRGCKLVD